MELPEYVAAEFPLLIGNDAEDAIDDPDGGVVVLHADADVHAPHKLEILERIFERIPSTGNRSHEKLESVVARFAVIVDVDDPLVGDLLRREGVDSRTLHRPFGGIQQVDPAVMGPLQQRIVARPGASHHVELAREDGATAALLHRQVVGHERFAARRPRSSRTRRRVRVPGHVINAE